MRKSSKVLGIVVLALLLLVASVWYALLREDRQGKLTVLFLDVGQGDAIFIDSPSGNQVLIDGGPDATVLRRLGSAMPLWDRTINVVIPTHPDSDHVAGLIDVLRRYHADYIMQSSVLGTTTTWHMLEQTIADAQKGGTKVLTAQRGQVIDLGDGVYLQILSPDRAVPNVSTNEGCVVTRLVYGKTAFMLPCDAPQDIENYLVYLDGAGLRSDVLKAGHHGSKTSSSPLFVGAVAPTYVVYSRGCNNRYGFPNPETVATFRRFGAVAEDTCTQGTVTFTSDGIQVQLD
jgi:competence protein ComEC